MDTDYKAIKEELQAIIPQTSDNLAHYLRQTLEAIKRDEVDYFNALKGKELAAAWNEHIAPIIGHKAAYGDYFKDSGYWVLHFDMPDNSTYEPKICNTFEESMELIVSKSPSIFRWRKWAEYSTPPASDNESE